MVCADCGSLAIKIENPEKAFRDAIVYCGQCGASRGTVGALRDLAARPRLRKDSKLLSTGGRAKKQKRPSEISENFKELQSLRREVQTAEFLESSKDV